MKEGERETFAPIFPYVGIFSYLIPSLIDLGEKERKGEREKRKKEVVF